MKLRRSAGALTLCLVTGAIVAPAAAHGFALYASVPPNTIAVIDTTTNERARADISATGLSSGRLVTSVDGRALYMSGNNAVSRLETQTDEVSGPASTSPGSPQAMALTPDGQTLYTSNFGANTVSVIDTTVMQTTDTIPHSGSVGFNSIVADPDGSSVYLIDNAGLKEIDTATGTISGPLNVLGGAPNNGVLTINPAGTRLYAGSGPNIYVISTTTFATLATVASPGTATGDLAVSPDGDHLYTANYLNDDVSTMRTSDNTFLAPDIPLPGVAPFDLAFTPDGDSLYVSGNSLAEIDPATRTVADSTIPIGGQNPAEIAVSRLGPAPPPPQEGKTVNVAPLEGKVEYNCPGKGGYKPLTDGKQIRLGCLLDTTRGHVLLTSAAGEKETQTAEFWAGVFRPEQTKNAKVTELSLAPDVGCKGAKGHSFAKGGRGNKLWGKGKGDFKSKGHKGSASVRGTTWLTYDRCNDTTYFKVKDGVVTVKDKSTGKTVVLRKGDSYTAGKRGGGNGGSGRACCFRAQSLGDRRPRGI